MMPREFEELRALLPEYVLGTLDGASAEELRDALSRSHRLTEEMRALVNALYVLPEALDPEPAPTAVWKRIRQGCHALAGAIDSEPGAATESPEGANAAAFEEPEGPPRAAESPRRGTNDAAGAGLRDRELRYPGLDPARRSRRLPRRLGFGLAAALVAAVLATTGLWAMRAATRADTLAREQQIIAYWLRRPDLEILPLQPIAGGEIPNWTGATEIPAGVVCLLPDGRAMLLQPSPPPRGTRYVLYGETARGSVELGETRQRFLLFDHRDLRSVTLAVEGRRNGTVARVRF